MFQNNTEGRLLISYIQKSEILLRSIRILTVLHCPHLKVQRYKNYLEIITVILIKQFIIVFYNIQDNMWEFEGQGGKKIIAHTEKVIRWV